MKSTATIRALRVLQIILLDVAVGLFFGLMVFEKADRWPVLVVVVPLVLFFNAQQLRKMQSDPSRISITLPIIYGTTLVYTVLWTIFSFEWWKLLIVPLPLLLMIYFHQRTKHAARNYAAKRRA